MTPRPVDVIAALPSIRPFVAPEELARTSGHADLLRLGANESAFGPAPAALAAMHASLERIAWYGDPESMELRETLAPLLGCGIENLLVGSGIDDLLATIVRAYLGCGDVAVATHGTYPTFAYHVAGYGGKLVTVPYAPGGPVHLEALASAARESGARIAYVANPDSPSGSFASRAEIDAFREALPPQCLFILDEAYAEFAPHAQLLPFDANDPTLVRTRTFSKAYGLAGARVGYLHAHASVVAQFNKVRTQYGVNRVAQAGALAALGDPAFVARVVRDTAAGRADYISLAERFGLTTLSSQTNFTCIDLGSRERAERMVAELLRRAVFVRKPGAPPLDGYVRITVGTAEERARFGTAFAQAFEALEAPSASLR